MTFKWINAIWNAVQMWKPRIPSKIPNSHILNWYDYVPFQGLSIMNNEALKSTMHRSMRFKPRKMNPRQRFDPFHQTAMFRLRYNFRNTYTFGSSEVDEVSSNFDCFVSSFLLQLQLNYFFCFLFMHHRCIITIYLVFFLLFIDLIADRFWAEIATSIIKESLAVPRSLFFRF